MSEKSIGLCYRCEWRARFLETGRRPRRECGDIKITKSACYMFKPCKLVVVSKLHPDDPRPLMGGYFSCRYRGVKLAEVELAGKEVKDGVLFYWKPVEE